jgi:hypothetical protein
MPHFTPCPWCNILIMDWFHEWYPKAQYEQIKLGQLAMDCPDHECRRPVTLNKGKVVPAQSLVTAERILTQAETWAVQQQGYPTLEAFLTHPDEQPRAKYFRSGYWLQINVRGRETPMSTFFKLSPAELDFLHHFNHESVTATPGPATLWLRQREIFPTVMQSFQYAEQQSNPRYIDRITEDPLPAFRPAWSSREEFHARASEIVAVYPELKQLGSALPGFQPNFTFAPEKVLS